MCVDPRNAGQIAVSEGERDSLRACCQTNHRHMIFVDTDVAFKAADDMLKIFQEISNFVILVLS